MKNFSECIARQLVDHQEKVIDAENYTNENTTEFIITLDKNDVGKIIGKQGRTINAMRELPSAISGKQHFKIDLNFPDSTDKMKT